VAEDFDLARAADPIVKPSNAEDLIRQWSDLHGISIVPSHEELIDGHSRRVWGSPEGEALIEAFSIGGLGHGVPLAGTDGCGRAGAFFLDAGISSTRHIASFWRLGESTVEMGRAPMKAYKPSEIRTATHINVVESEAANGRTVPELTSVDLQQDLGRRFLDPNDVIAAAFKAAGLPAPKLEGKPAAIAHWTAPGPIIEAAFKGAQLLSRRSTNNGIK
jgi:hypothetical protein